jgi:hypothetical protein
MRSERIPRSRFVSILFRSENAPLGRGTYSAIQSEDIALPRRILNDSLLSMSALFYSHGQGNRSLISSIR